MIAGGLIGRFIESPDQVLKNMAHLHVPEGLGMHVDIRELGHYEIKTVGFIKLVDFLLKLEVLDEDATDILGETCDVSHEMLADVVRVVEQGRL